MDYMDKHKTVRKRIASLYESSKWCDIEFHLTENVTGETVVSRAHRIILSTCGPVLEALCFGPLADKDVVQVPDILPDAFKSLLEYLYTDKMELASVEIASSVYYSGKKYMLDNVCKLAGEYLLNNMDECSCFDVFNLAIFFDDCHLITESYNYIHRHLQFVAKCAKKETVNLELITKLLNDGDFNADEITLVVLAQMWALEHSETSHLEPSSSNVRTILHQNNIFQKIRWELLKPEDLPQVLSGLLTDSEIDSINNPIDECCGMDRMKPAPKLSYIHRFIQGGCRKKHKVPDQLTVSTKLTLNHSAVLYGIFVCSRVLSEIYTIHNGAAVSKYKERIQVAIYNSKSEKAIDEFFFDGEVSFNTSYLVKLASPLLFKADRTHDIRITLLKDASNYDFRYRNAVGKVPCCLTVSFDDKACLDRSGDFVSTPHLSVITGLQISR